MIATIELEPVTSTVAEINDESLRNPFVVTFPGQGQDPRAIADVSEATREVFEEVTNLKISDIAELPDEVAYTGKVAQPLHILRLLGYYESFNRHLEDNGRAPINEQNEVIFIPASLSEYLGYHIIGAWSLETTFMAAQKRGEISDTYANDHPGKYAMLATYLKDIRKSEILSDTDDEGYLIEQILTLIQGVLDTKLDVETHKLQDGVYVGSYPSPGMATLTGERSELEKVHDALRKHSRVIGSTLLRRINGAYHYIGNDQIRREMQKFIDDADTRDPNAHMGTMYSPTSGRPILTASDVRENSIDLIIRPVDQRGIFLSIAGVVMDSDIRTLPALEFGKAEDYPWDKQQGVQSSCIRDFARFFPFYNRRGVLVPVDSITFDATGKSFSPKLEGFIDRHLPVAK